MAVVCSGEIDAAARRIAIHKFRLADQRGNHVTIAGSRDGCEAARRVLEGLYEQVLRGQELTSYHGAEHVSIGSYEHGEKRAKEHERCGSHLIGPLLAATAAGNVLAFGLLSLRRQRDIAVR